MEKLQQIIENLQIIKNTRQSRKNSDLQTNICKKPNIHTPNHRSLPNYKKPINTNQ